MGTQFDLSAVVTGDYGKLFVIGVQYTFILFVLSWLASMSVGTILAVLSLSRSKVLRWLVAVLVAYHRNVPLLVQLMLWYFAIPRTLPTSVTSVINSWRPEVAYAVIALSLCCGAYIAEDIRSGLRAIPRTQFEASRSIGFSRFQSMRWVILPQAFRLSLPALINDTLDLFKGTSIAAVIGVGELTYQMRLIENETFRIYEVFIVVSAIYFSVTIPFMILAAAASRNAALYRK
ncbi:MAG: amino acid ABC transporter permease [Mesorhizobium sp.]|uniref:amino acid ABC transporter permease n=1 Tax=Mesorhizobium sp. TaxID=1871066 RepID=UPI000FE8F6F7|nr:amino acid ABC transporter permease [Mesorhizobium sp.]RWB32160.1 MAG: amino acid ABC transporter permease [Mesorhizobium sp.]RWB81216.1 MAG: amino acid ABC transporter permease [Mesorhizobium sp.]RWF79306.1 MAG: amino acid ABC transporter permease [Mesorhizobium sp.]TIS68472.1 MAG: amino acid ABC transporter permease [Mesorhizobium sp.]TIW51098.1 MAG: amino acid ABC transporter permease [Mesorhizobium sp.]